jgi:hypothetical protein
LQLGVAATRGGGIVVVVWPSIQSSPAIGAERMQVEEMGRRRGLG